MIQLGTYPFKVVLVHWLWEMTHIREVVGLNPGAIYWMYLTFCHIVLLYKLYRMFEKTKR